MKTNNPKMNSSQIIFNNFFKNILVKNSSDLKLLFDKQYTANFTKCMIIIIRDKHGAVEKGFFF